MNQIFLYVPTTRTWEYFETDPEGNRIGVRGAGTNPVDAIDNYIDSLPVERKLHRDFFLDMISVRH